MNANDLKQISELLNQKLQPIENELKEHGKLLKSHSKILKSHSNLLKNLKKDQDVMLDREQMKQRKRVDRIEEHIGISSRPY